MNTLPKYIDFQLNLIGLEWKFMQFFQIVFLEVVYIERNNPGTLIEECTALHYRCFSAFIYTGYLILFL